MSAIKQIALNPQFAVNGGRASALLPLTPVSGWPVTITVDGVSSYDHYNVSISNRAVTADIEIIDAVVTVLMWAYVSEINAAENIEPAIDPGSGIDPGAITDAGATPATFVVGDFWPEWPPLTDDLIDSYDPAVEMAPQCYGVRPDCIAMLQARLSAAGVGIEGAFNAA